MSKPATGGFRRIMNATVFSLKGLRAAWQNEQAFRQEVMLAVIGLPLGWWLGVTGVQRALLMGAVLLVLVVELLNSAVEAVVDRVGVEKNKLAGQAKDMGSAAVMVSILTAALVWALVLFDRFS